MFCPSGHCLCRTLQSESTRIWNDLQDAETLNSPIHEDTITQMLALNLNRQHGGQNRVHLFGRAEEAQNGSDFLWLFFSSDLARHFRVAVQAKRLYPGGKYGAFKTAQALTMYAYARSISAASVYVNGGAKLVHPGGAKLVHLTLCGTRCWGVVRCGPTGSTIAPAVKQVFLGISAVFGFG